MTYGLRNAHFRIQSAMWPAPPWKAREGVVSWPPPNTPARMRCWILFTPSSKIHEYMMQGKYILLLTIRTPKSLGKNVTGIVHRGETLDETYQKYSKVPSPVPSTAAKVSRLFSWLAAAQDLPMSWKVLCYWQLFFSTTVPVDINGAIRTKPLSLVKLCQTTGTGSLLPIFGVVMIHWMCTPS